MKRRKDKTNFPNNVNKKCTNNKKVFLTGLIILAASISGILAIFLPSAAIRVPLLGMCFAPLLLQSAKEGHLLGHRML
ncbi:MAG: hypothetical protein WBE34_14685 [Candidatus Nitrosopolaris sp.]